MKYMRKILELNNVEKKYDETVVITDLSFSLQQGKIGCLLGPSGCGKTTILRAIAGFEKINSGSIRIGDKVVSSPDNTVSTEKRDIGMIFQDYALFPHLTVQENIAFGLHGKSKNEQGQIVEELLTIVGLQGTAQKYPHELSGGQQQRVALSRALAPKPALLLMDEPFSNLDVTLRERLSVEVRDILKSYGMTALMVTHNQLEAFAMADHVGVVYDGKLDQWDTAANLYHHPCNEKVAKFIGEGVLIKGEITSHSEIQTGLGKLAGNISVQHNGKKYVKILVRPEDIIHNDESLFKATIIKKNFRGANILYTLKLPNGELVLSLVESHHDHQLGQQIGINQKIEDLVVYQ